MKMDMGYVNDLVYRLKQRARNCDSQPPNVQASWKPKNQLEWEAAEVIELLVSRVLQLEEEAR